MAMIKVHANPRTSLKRRIKQFYDLLNRRDFTRCHHMIDPRLRSNPRAVTRFQYETSLREFVDRVDSVTVLSIDIEVYRSAEPFCTKTATSLSARRNGVIKPESD